VSESNLPLFQAMERIQVLELEQESLLLKGVIGISLGSQTNGVMPEREVNQEATKGAGDLYAQLEELNLEVSETYDIGLEAARQARDHAKLQEDADVYNKIIESLETIEATHVAFSDAIGSFLETLKSDTTIQVLMSGWKLTEEDGVLLKEELGTFVDHVRILVDHNVEEIGSVQSSAKTFIIIIIAIIFAIVAVLLIVVNNIVLKPLRRFTESMEVISTGDFSVDIPTKVLNRKDEIGTLATSLNHLKTNVAELLLKVKKASDSVATSSTSLAVVSEQSSYAMNEITDAMTQIADTSQEQTNQASTVVFRTNDLGEQIQESMNIY